MEEGSPTITLLGWECIGPAPHGRVYEGATLQLSAERTETVIFKLTAANSVPVREQALNKWVEYNAYILS